MPRPKEGYRNSAGQPIPGTHDPISRFMDQTALKYWAYKQGKEGKSLYDNSAIDIGACVHTMAEQDLRGDSDSDIRYYLKNTLRDPDDLQKAATSFKAFRNWREQFHVRPIAQEVTLISERHQFGGTPDTIALVNNGLALIDFKTSAKVYPDHLIAMAAHGVLWAENNPTKPLTGGYHLICLPKDGSAFQHHAYDDLSPQWELFQLYLRAWHLDKACAKMVTGATKPAPQPRARIEAPRPPMTMGEMLRAYGHVKQQVSA